jgi:hypothetical protein
MLFFTESIPPTLLKINSQDLLKCAIPVPSPIVAIWEKEVPETPGNNSRDYSYIVLGV